MRFLNFRKKQQSDTVPTLAEQEYTVARKQRRGVALLIAVVTFIVAGFLAIVLFFGGRWFYRVANVDKITRPISSQLQSTPAQQRSGSDETATPPSPDAGTNPDNTSPNTPPPTTAPTPVTPPPANPSPTTPPVAGNTPQPGSPVPAPNGNIPNNMPDTGPSGVAAIVLVTTLAATGFYQLRLRRKSV